MIKNAFRSVFITEYREKQRNWISNHFLQVLVDERVYVSGEWLTYFKKLIQTLSNGVLKLAARRADADVVLKYKMEAFFTLIKPNNEYIQICLCPEWIKPFCEHEPPASSNNNNEQQDKAQTSSFDWRARADNQKPQEKSAWSKCMIM